MAADRHEAGAWVWASSFTESKIWHLYGDKSTSWSVGDDAAVRSAAAIPSMAACGASAWLGVGDHLVEVHDPGGVARNVHVPAAPPNPAVEDHRPASIVGASAIQAVACNDDRVAIARSDAAAGFIYDRKTDSFTSVTIPEDDDAVSVAISDDGVVAFALQNYRGLGPHAVLLVEQDGRTTMTVKVENSMSVRAAPGGFVAGTAGQRIIVGTDVSSAEVEPSLKSLHGNGVDPGTAAVATTADGRTILGTSTGLDVAGPAEKTVLHVDLGVTTCPAPTGPYDPKRPFGEAPSTSVATSCPERPTVLAVDGEGTVWWVPARSSDMVRRIPLG